MLQLLPDAGIGLLRAERLGGRRPLAAREAAVAAERPVPAPGEGGFEARYREHADAVERLCRRMLGRERAGEDAAQEVFLRARRGFASYDPSLPFRPWLLSVASHHCIDQLRRRGRELRLFEPRELDASDLVDAGASPLRHALDAERRARVLTALDHLPLKYRLPLVLRYFEELDYQGIAELLGVTRGQVGTLLFRAKLRLREQLEDEVR